MVLTKLSAKFEEFLLSRIISLHCNQSFKEPVSLMKSIPEASHHDTFNSFFLPKFHPPIGPVNSVGLPEHCHTATSSKLKHVLLICSRFKKSRSHHLEKSLHFCLHRHKCWLLVNLIQIGTALGFPKHILGLLGKPVGSSEMRQVSIRDVRDLQLIQPQRLMANMQSP